MRKPGGNSDSTGGSMSPLDRDRHRLDPVTHEAIFREKIIPRQGFDRAFPWRHPTAYVLGGQPGAGKSRTKSAIVPVTLDRQGRPHRGAAIEIAADTFRTYHPKYRHLQALDDRTAAAFTDTDARLWVDKAVDYAIERRANVIFDTLLSRPETAEPMTRRFRDAGYRIEVAFVAVPAGLSLLGNLHRYQSIVDQQGFGRLCDRETHDRAYNGVLATAERIDQNRLVDAVHVYRRGGERIYTNHQAADGNWIRPPATVAAIETERSRPRTPVESQELVAQIEHLARRVDAEHRVELREIIEMTRPLLDPEELAVAQLDQIVEDPNRAQRTAELARHNSDRITISMETLESKLAKLTQALEAYRSRRAESHHFEMNPEPPHIDRGPDHSL
jgi:UDP-N-acetylglucosamine kinase